MVCQVCSVSKQIRPIFYSVIRENDTELLVKLMFGLAVWKVAMLGFGGRWFDEIKPSHSSQPVE